MKKIIALCLALTLCLSAFAGCSGGGASSSGGSSSGEGATSESSASQAETGSTNEAPYEVNFVYVVASAGSNMDKVREAVNELALKEINMKVNLIPLTFSEFTTQLPMMLAANEALDVFSLSPGVGPTYIASQYIVDLSPYKDSVPDIVAAVGEDMIDVGYIGDFLTGFPNVKEQAMPASLIVRKDIFDELGFSVDDFHVTTDDLSSFDEILNLFATVQAAYPNMTMFDGTGALGSQMPASYVDGLGNNFGVLANYGQDTTITNFYESDLYRQFCLIQKEWYDLGYASQDIAVNTDSGEVKMKAGNTFSFLIPYKPNTKQEKLAQTGYEVEIIPLGETMRVSTGMSIWAVANASKDPAKAVEFLNWTYSNGEFEDLINWGIEGEDWIELEDGTAGYPEGVDATNVGYHQDMGWLYPNQFAGHVWDGNPSNIKEQYDEFHANAIASKGLGFNFDPTDVTTEITQLTAVEDKYEKDLAFGVVEDIDATLKAFNDELYAAGLEEVMQAKQEQLDAWLAEQ